MLQEEIFTRGVVGRWKCAWIATRKTHTWSSLEELPFEICASFLGRCKTFVWESSREKHELNSRKVGHLVKPFSHQNHTFLPPPSSVSLTTLGGNKWGIDMPLTPCQCSVGFLPPNLLSPVHSQLAPSRLLLVPPPTPPSLSYNKLIWFSFCMRPQQQQQL